MQASHCEPPVVPLNVPGRQLVQVLETAAAMVPAAQVLQLTEPATAALPAAQFTQAKVAPGENLPPSQLAHLVEPVRTAYKPEAQAVQAADAPVDAENFPAAQAVHPVELLLAWNVPAEHTTHEAEPVAGA